MEQTIVDFFAKSTELILHNRLTSIKSLEAALNKMTNTNPSKFQLTFDQKFNFNSKIPSNWNTQNNKLLVLEFFLRTKTTNEKFLVEQWIFELNQITDNKLKYTIDSPSALYKKLSVLLRTISLLTVTLPLYRYFINDKNSQLAQTYELEHSINLTKHTLSNWHTVIYEERNLANYTNPDLVLPGRNFAFKVNYPKSFKFLQKIADETISKDPQPLVILKEKLEMDYFGHGRRERGMSEGGNVQSYFKSVRKSTSDSNRANNISGGRDYNSPADVNPPNSEGISENLSPMGSLLTSSPIETQKSPLHRIEGRSRKNSGGGNIPWENTKNSVGNRPRFATINSESDGEYDMYIYEDAEGKFTEVLSSKEIETRNGSGEKFNIHPKASEDESLLELAKKIETQELKLSTNTKPIEKIIEQTDDDKIAEIIQVIDELKDFYNMSYSGKDSLANTKVSNMNVNSLTNLSPKANSLKGLKFSPEASENGNKGSSTLFADYQELGALYSALKEY